MTMFLAVGATEKLSKLSNSLKGGDYIRKHGMRIQLRDQ
jgi:hypothetical protein